MTAFRQLRRCINDNTPPPRTSAVIGSLVLLMGLQITRILELTTNDVAVQEATVQLKLDGTLLQLPPRLAQLVLKHLEHAEGRLGGQPGCKHHPMAVRRSKPGPPQSSRSTST